MNWAKLAVALGAVLLLGGFAVAVEVSPSATLEGQSYRCDSAIKTGWLVSGQSSSTGPGGRAEERLAARVDAACGPVETLTRTTLLTVLALGGLTMVAGWSVLRRDERDEAGDLLQFAR